jgi:hypothetical protein
MKTKTRRRIIAADLAREVNKLLLSLPTGDLRVAALQLMAEGICVNCGEMVGDAICHCTNDE